MDKNIDVCTIKKDELNELRIRIKFYNSQKYIDIRNFCKSENSDKMYPTKKGVMIHSNDFRDFAKGLQTVAIKMDEIKQS